MSSRKWPAPLKYQFNRGYYDFKNGRTRCPFNLESDRGKEWLRGFNAGYFENLEKLDGNRDS